MKEVRLINPSGMCECINIMIIISDITCSICCFSNLGESISVENATFIPDLCIFSPASVCSSSDSKAGNSLIESLGLKECWVICGGGLNELRADHQILKQAFLLEGSSSIYRGSADFPEGPACNLQPDILFAGSSLSRWRHPC